MKDFIFDVDRQLIKKYFYDFPLKENIEHSGKKLYRSKGKMVSVFFLFFFFFFLISN